MGSEHLQTVLPYSGVAPAQAPWQAGWRALPDGVELVVPPPAVWRLLAGPSVGLVALTTLAGAGVAWGVFTVESVRARGRLPTSAEGVLLLGGAIGAAAAGLAALVWAVGAVGRRTRARRRPSVIRVDAGTVSIESPAWRRTRSWRVASVSSVHMEWDRALLPPFVPHVRLQVNGDGVAVVRIPWGGDETPASAERRLREALGLGRRNLSPARHLAAVVERPERSRTPTPG